MGAPDRTECVTCKATGSKYKCPACRLPYCSVACCREHKGAPPISYSRNSQFRAPRTLPNLRLVPLSPLQRNLARRRRSPKKSHRRKNRRRQPRPRLHDRNARSKRTRRTKTARDSVESTCSRLLRAKRLGSAWETRGSSIPSHASTVPHALSKL